MKTLNLALACFILAVGTSTAQNLLANGSFDGSLNGWGYGGATSYDSTLDATGTSGSGSAKTLVPPLLAITGVTQCIAIEGSTQYKAGGRIFIPSGQATTGAADIYVNFYSGSDCNSGYLDFAVTRRLESTAGWVSVDTGFITSHPSARSAGFGTELVNHGTASSPSFQVNFDDLFLSGSGPSGYTRWIPAVIHKDVPSKNAKWRSDVAVLNRSASAAGLTITMHPPAGPVSKTTQVAGNSQLLLTDIAGWLGVTADSGALEVTSDQDFFLSGRTYNQVDDTHTYGQDYDGQMPSELLLASGAAATAWLPQLTENALYRTNIGITNTGTQTATVTLTLYDANGNQVGNDDTRDYASGVFYQYQQPYLANGGIAGGYAKVTVNSGSGVVAYASVIDNNTGDPTTITMKR